MFSSDEIRASMRLYAVTDKSWLLGRSLVSCVARAIDGGVTCVQLREKGTSPKEAEVLARELKELCREKGIPFIVNDDVFLAQRIGADGVHVGQEDIDCAKARELLGPDVIIGVSVQTLEEAQLAQKAGADYLGVGALFGTPTKPDAVLVSLETLKKICVEADIPVVAIGGINQDTIPQLSKTGIDGVAVVSAIFAAEDIEQATKELSEQIEAYILR